MLFWIGWFARLHANDPPYVPYEIKTLDCPVVAADGTCVLGSDGQPVRMRCAREVAHHEVNGEVEWLMISWKIGVPGMSIQTCASLDEALTAFLAPPNTVSLPV